MEQFAFQTSPVLDMGRRKTRKMEGDVTILQPGTGIHLIHEIMITICIFKGLGSNIVLGCIDRFLKEEPVVFIKCEINMYNVTEPLNAGIEELVEQVVARQKGFRSLINIALR
jgi:hypothetical protein